MNQEVSTAGTTVTVFGGSDPFDHALGTQLNRRGCRTHVVSVPTGWLRTVTHAVMRLDTAAGAEAFQQLAETSQPYSHVVAVCPEPAEQSEADRVREMCRTCGMHHDVSLIWHPPFDTDGAAHAVSSSSMEVTTNALAATVADEVVDHAAVGQPNVDTRAFLLDEDPH